jgi:hypothetical protein
MSLQLSIHFLSTAAGTSARKLQGMLHGLYAYGAYGVVLFRLVMFIASSCYYAFSDLMLHILKLKGR